MQKNKQKPRTEKEEGAYGRDGGLMVSNTVDTQLPSEILVPLEAVKKEKKGFVRQLLFREAFVWEKEIEDFVRKMMSGYTLNVPCGKSKLGDVRLDIDANLSMKEAYNFFNEKIPYPDNTFDTVISDPPWHIGHYFRPKLFFALVDVCKVGGTIIYNATWIPTSKYVKLKELWIRQSSQFSNVSIISVFEKIGNSPKKSHISKLGEKK